jgi:hypothetical protein
MQHGLGTGTACSSHLELWMKEAQAGVCDGVARLPEADGDEGVAACRP